MKKPSSIDTLLEHALKHTATASSLFNDRLLIVQATRHVEQPDLLAASLFQKLGKAACAPAESFNSLARSLYLEAEAKARADAPDDAPAPLVQLSVEMGPRALAFEDHRRVNISWRSEAEKQALVLHAVAAAYASGDHAAMQTLLKPYQGPFNVTLWESAIKAGVPKKGELTPKILP